MKRIFLLLLTISLVGCKENPEEKNKQIESFLNNLNSEDFSGVILVAQNDSISQKRAYGLASIEYNAENKIDTKFNIASITKMITAVAILQLYEKGKIDLKTSIGKYLPEYPNKLVRDSVTTHQLLTHTSGLNNNLDFWKSNNLEYQKVSDFATLFENDTLLSQPGAKYNYSFSGFVILGLLIEKVSGQSYYQYVKENILVPTGMENTIEIEIDSVVSNKASGYTSSFGESSILKRNDYYLIKTSPAGFHYSTVEDLFNFSKALRNGKLLKKKTTELMFEPKVRGYNTHLGYGIDIDQRYNQIIQGHSGGWYGIHCELMDFMDDNYTVVILSNIDDGGKKGASLVTDFFKQTIANKEPFE